LKEGDRSFYPTGLSLRDASRDRIIWILLLLSHLPDEGEKTQSACLPCGIQGYSTGAAETMAS